MTGKRKPRETLFGQKHFGKNCNAKTISFVAKWGPSTSPEPPGWAAACGAVRKLGAGGAHGHGNGPSTIHLERKEGIGDGRGGGRLAMGRFRRGFAT